MAERQQGALCSVMESAGWRLTDQRSPRPQRREFPVQVEIFNDCDHDGARSSEADDGVDRDILHEHSHSLRPHAKCTDCRLPQQTTNLSECTRMYFVPSRANICVRCIPRGGVSPEVM